MSEADKQYFAYLETVSCHLRVVAGVMGHPRGEVLALVTALLASLKAAEPKLRREARNWVAIVFNEPKPARKRKVRK